MALFAPPIPPQQEPTGDIKFGGGEVRYGEGYVQSWGEGMNDKRQNWPFTWVGTNAEIQAIVDFFDLHKGYQSFTYQPPFSPTVLRFRVKSYQLVPSAASNAKVSALFEQVYYP